MAETDKSFPKIAEANWWKVRDLFKRRVPTSVTPNYLASALSMNETSAKSNIATPFKKIGLIDGEGKPTDLAYDWRDDDKYTAVCNTILESCYPQEVRDLYHDKDQDLSGLMNWFRNYARCGEVAARMYSSFYRLLLRADPNEQTISQPSQANSLKPKKTRKTSKETNSTQVLALQDESTHQVMAERTLLKQQAPVHFSSIPQVHVNIQLHIAPETTAEQIDKIFESMAKHLKSLSIQEG